MEAKEAKDKSRCFVVRGFGSTFLLFLVGSVVSCGATRESAELSAKFSWDDGGEGRKPGGGDGDAGGELRSEESPQGSKGHPIEAGRDDVLVPLGTKKYVGGKKVTRTRSRSNTAG